MRAAIYRQFSGPILIEDVADPVVPRDGVVIRVGASGLCRSDLHGWEGNDPSIRLPHVPGHELAGTIEAIGAEVTAHSVGERVTVPFAVGCGVCARCQTGNEQICDSDFQPGFTGWGSFAELVAIPHADRNLVRLPTDMKLTTAALLGCRFGTAYRAVVDRGMTRPDQWLAVHGCGGLGLSVVMVAVGLGARVVAIDIQGAALAKARSLGAEQVIDPSAVTDLDSVIADITGGGADVSLDTLGSEVTATGSILGLRKQGRHVQVGLLFGGPTPLPMDIVIARELEIVGSHGLAAHEYPAMLEFLESRQIDPGQLVEQELTLEQLPEALAAMKVYSTTGVAVVTQF